MPNTNCLENIQCPKCGYESRFFVCVTITAEVTDDGADIAPCPRGDIEWDEKSRIECPGCGATGTVAEFTVEQPDAPLPVAGYTTFQLAPDEATYGAHAGKFIVSSSDYEHGFAGPMARKDAEAFAAALNACQLVVDRWERGNLAEAARACSAAISQASDGARTP